MIEDCERCGAKIEQPNHTRKHPVDVCRKDGVDEIETASVLLCSMCENDLWDWVHGKDAPDRSDMADPIPIERMGESIDQYIEDLQDTKEELSELLEGHE